MNIYNDYIKTIRSAMNADKKSSYLNESISHFDGNIEKGLIFQKLAAEISDKRLLPSLDDFAKELGLIPNFNQQLGLHPDFAHLKNSNTSESHYIVSMFIDVKGSTNLFKKYSPETVFIITNTIQRAAIHTCLIFGGYIHRLQGDGLFVYYGRKGMDISTAVLRSLQSASVFTYFVKNDLKNLFNEQGIEDIVTRIGIDLGHDRDVIWAMAGIGEISEVTTCSLHTSLASKMQGSAMSNGTVIGDNIKNQMPSLNHHFIPVCQRTKSESDRYIFQIPEEKFNYTQYDFNWLNFLKQQDFVATDLLGNVNMKNKVINGSSENLKSLAATSKPYYNF